LRKYEPLKAMILEKKYSCNKEYMIYIPYMQRIYDLYMLHENRITKPTKIAFKGELNGVIKGMNLIKSTLSMYEYFAMKCLCSINTCYFKIREKKEKPWTDKFMAEIY
jgi:hypothetical protein